MSSKRVVVTFNSSPKRYDTDMELAKDALEKAKEAGIDNGQFEIGNICIEIQNLSGGK